MKIVALLLVLAVYDPVQLALDKVNFLMIRLDQSQEVNLRYELLEIHRLLYISRQQAQAQAQQVPPLQHQQPQLAPQPTQSQQPIDWSKIQYPPPVPKTADCDTPFGGLFKQ